MEYTIWSRIDYIFSQLYEIEKLMDFEISKFCISLTKFAVTVIQDYYIVKLKQ